ncbi:uncharacterized protein EI97DRAFT_466483 [Westerdykella ornata]|uniref:Wbp11/ELF5/Saf1 N-terminal domain-containing protein n=1 Tax=Westerdykella ornata TaxID=318751 RepID=A0A6A6JMD1_WESOR|nr:uncharacterized protein EI97DRAFT_466483 [Westerdykella ornata]KAF2277667.1 hypothetical protein EI97DRAFT_466483 [Westerdykella ornata]
MPKEKNYNPVQEAKKAEKQKQIKKQKAAVQAQRNEKLARRNPARIQRDIDSLKALAESGDLRPHERQRLSELEKNLAAVNKARAALGDKAPQFKEWKDHGGERGGRGGPRGGRGGVLGKRSRDGSWKGRDGEESSDTDPDVAHIPMPRDTPPPIPRRRKTEGEPAEPQAPPEPKKATVVYEAEPQHRDLRKEAARFVPAAVAQKLKQAKGQGQSLEETTSDRLKKEEYMDQETREKKTEDTDKELEEFLKQVGDAPPESNQSTVTGNNEIKEASAEIVGRKPHQVTLEEVEDEDE